MFRHTRTMKWVVLFIGVSSECNQHKNEERVSGGKASRRAPYKGRRPATDVNTTSRLPGTEGQDSVSIKQWGYVQFSLVLRASATLQPLIHFPWLSLFPILTSREIVERFLLLEDILLITSRPRVIFTSGPLSFSFIVSIKMFPFYI